MAKGRKLADLERALLDAVALERGHFRYESGHHGNLWLDLDRFLIDARRVRLLASALAERAAACRPELICGPLTGGAFVAQFVAAELDAGFVHAERIAASRGAPAYRIPGPLQASLQTRRVLLVDDAVNAGSALLASRAGVLACGGAVVGSASLIALGQAAAKIAAVTGVSHYRLVDLERGLWLPAACPLCASGRALVDRIPRP